MNDSPKPPPRRGLEGRSLIVVAIIVVAALAIFLFSTDDTPVPDVESGGPGGEWTADPQPIPQLPPEEEAPQEPAN